jgi:hypothetical protein
MPPVIVENPIFQSSCAEPAQRLRFANEIAGSRRGRHSFVFNLDLP